jgi:segregation and condensation protein A
MPLWAHITMANFDTDDWATTAQPTTADRLDAENLIVDVDGFEGPLDLLLMLSRTQKVDLRRISVLQLAHQYLAFVEKARALRIELAADYLVMAAWLAFLKSRLLLPPIPGEDGPSAEDLAAHLAFQLERLSAMREAAARLMARDQLGRDFFARGIPEDVTKRTHITYEATLLDLMRAYARTRTKDDFRPYAFDRKNIFTMEQALDRMRGLLGYAGEWSDLTTFLPTGWDASPERRRSATASHFAAILEMAKAGQVKIKQSDTFSPILVRRSDTP